MNTSYDLSAYTDGTYLLTTHIYGYDNGPSYEAHTGKIYERYDRITAARVREIVGSSHVRLLNFCPDFMPRTVEAPRSMKYQLSIIDGNHWWRECIFDSKEEAFDAAMLRANKISGKDENVYVEYEEEEDLWMTILPQDDNMAQRLADAISARKEELEEQYA